jgi:hypothetical protein
VPDLARLGELYTIALVGAMAVMFAGCGTDPIFEIRSWERAGLLVLSVFCTAVFATASWHSPLAFAYVAAVVLVGLTARALVQNRASVREWMLTPPPNPLVYVTPVSAAPISEPAPVRAPKLLGGWETRPRIEHARRVLLLGLPSHEILKFAVEEAKLRRADLLVLPGGEASEAAVAVADEAAVRLLASAEGIRVEFLPPSKSIGAEEVVSAASGRDVRLVVVGADRKDDVGRTLHKDVIPQIAERLPTGVRLLVCS